MQDGVVDPGPPFPNYLDKQIGFHLPVVYDAAPIGKDFGGVKSDVKTNDTYQAVSPLLCTAAV